MYDLFLIGPPAEGSSPFAPLIFMGLIFVVFWFLLIRPQQKKEKERRAMIAAVKKGDNIVSVGGLYGKVTQVDETSVLAQVDENVKVRIDKNAISSVRK